MWVQGIVISVVVLFLTGCNRYEIKPELADSSGKYDGKMSLLLSNRHSLQTFGRFHYTCLTDSFSRYFIVQDGLVWADNSDESVGVISPDGDIYIRELAGSYTSDTG